MTPANLRALADQCTRRSLEILNAEPDIADPESAADSAWFSRMLAMAVKTRLAADMLAAEARRVEMAERN